MKNNTADQIISLRNRLEKVKNEQIRLTSRKETLSNARDELIREIKEAGFDPSTLTEVERDLKSKLEAACSELDDKLSQAESVLNSITE